MRRERRDLIALMLGALLASASLGASSCSTGVAAPTTGSLTVENATAETVLCDLHVVPFDVEGWGDDLLGGGSLAPGESLVLEDLPETFYDMRARDCAGEVVAQRFDVRVTAGQSAGWVITD